MKQQRIRMLSFVAVSAVSLTLALLAGGCRPPFPQCRDDDDCKAEEKNKTLFVCVNGQCQECGKDADCPKDRPRCKDNRCVECIENKDCPEDKPYCENERCVYECEIDPDCVKRDKAGMICKDHKCKWECEQDSDCAEGMECKDHRCVVKCKCQSDADCPEGKMCSSCECIDKPKCQLSAIYFDFDRHDLRTDARSTLDQNAECLRSRADMSVTIEGHCDERGTEEYNLTLGDKRARSAQKYLQNLGIPAHRLNTITYGKNRPTCRESSEDCWSQNRRDEFVEK